MAGELWATRWAWEEVHVEQNSPEWYAARAGRATASRASSVTAKGRGNEESKMRRNYRVQLACERITGRSQEDDYTNRNMERGHELEPMARRAYEARTGDVVQRCGFLSCQQHLAGASLDGYVDRFGGIVSIKCPIPAIHVGYLRGRRLPPEYLDQAVHEMMLVPTAQWYDFCSYNAELPILFVVRVERGELAREMAEYEEALLRFLDEVSAEVRAIEALRS